MTLEQKEYLMHLSYTYIQYGKYEDSLILLSFLKTIYPKDGLIMLLKGYAYLQLEKYNEAKLEIEESLPRVDTLAYRQSAYLMRAQALYGLEDYEEAKEEFQRYVQLMEQVA